MSQIILLMIGGALGTLARYWTSLITHKWTGLEFPFGTLIVNGLGSLLIGFLWGFWERTGVSPGMKVFLFVGLLGGFTTFSRFSLETLNLFKSGQYKLALLNVAANNLISLSTVVLGYFAGKFCSRWMVD